MSIFGQKKFSLSNEIAKLHEEISIIEETKAMVNSPGWKRLREWALDKVVSYDQHIVVLAKNATKNAVELEQTSALRDAIKGLLMCVETTLAAEPEIKKKLRICEETTGLTGPDVG